MIISAVTATDIKPLLDFSGVGSTAWDSLTGSVCCKSGFVSCLLRV